jgi:hypothetical protein
MGFFFGFGHEGFTAFKVVQRVFFFFFFSLSRVFYSFLILH